MLLLFRKGKSGENYNVGTGFNLKNISLAKKILKFFIFQKIKIGKKSRVVFVKDRPGHDFRYALNFEKKKKIEMEAKTKIDDGLNKTIKWYNNNREFLKKCLVKIYLKDTD